jgi:FMN phosphatase YigB (HAD superfamily)
MKFKTVLEAVKPPQGSGIIIFDIDDTLVKARGIRIYKTKNGKDVEALTPEQFEKADKEKAKKEGFDFDFRDFRDESKLYSSIVRGQPIIRNLKVLDAHLRAGWDIGFLTARAGESANKKAIRKWLKYKDEDGNLKTIPEERIKYFIAVNDSKRQKEFKNAVQEGETHDAKKFFLGKIQSKYDEVKFVDDSLRNVLKARDVLPKKNVVKAQED